MTEKTIDIDQRHGMAAQKSTDLRRLPGDLGGEQGGLAPSAG
jgi:hypothetical protein